MSASPKKYAAAMYGERISNTGGADFAVAVASVSRLVAWGEAAMAGPSATEPDSSCCEESETGVPATNEPADSLTPGMLSAVGTLLATSVWLSATTTANVTGKHAAIRSMPE